MFVLVRKFYFCPNYALDIREAKMPIKSGQAGFETFSYLKDCLDEIRGIVIAVERLAEEAERLALRAREMLSNVEEIVEEKFAIK